jgi:hypothetical protein
MKEKQQSLNESKKKITLLGRAPSLLGSITGQRSLSGTLSAKGTGSFEVMSGRDLEVDADAPRDRSNTAPESEQIAPSSREELATVSETHQLVQEELPEEDAELKVAMAMALAIQNNPNLTPDEIRELVGAGTQQQGQPAVNTAHSASMLLPGRLSSMFQSASSDVDGKEKKASRSSGLRSMGESLQKRVSKGRLTDILTGGSKSAADDANETSIRDEPAPLSTTSTSSSKEGKRGPFRQARTPRSPPASPRVESGTKVIANVTNAPDDVLLPTNMLANASERIIGVASGHSLTAHKPSETAPIRLAGIAWKRRSGLGKYSATSAWERRRIELQGTRLLYYRTEKEAQDVKDLSPTSSREEALLPNSFSEDPKDNEGVVVAKRSNWFEQAAANWTHSDDPAAPRGYVDLVKEKATAHVAFGHSGAPSPFAISLKVRGETKWKLCFDYHSTQMEWLAALTDVVVQTSIDAYNTNLLEAADPANQAESVYFPPGAVNEPPTAADEKRDLGQHRLWMMEPYSIRSLDNAAIEEESENDMSESDADETMIDEADPGQIQEISREMSGDSALLDPISIQAAEDATAKIWSIPQNNLIYVFGVFNTALAFAQTSSTTMEGFWYIVVFANLGLFLFLVKEPDWRVLAQQVRVTTASSSSNPGNLKSKMKATALASKSAPLKVASKNSGYVPMAGTTAVRLKNATDPPENKQKQMFAGFRSIPGEILMVRSHGYAVTKKKVSSPGEMYDCAHTDIFESPSRYPDMAQRVKLPKVQYDDGGLPKTWRAPDIFIMSIALPTDPPKLGRNSSDGGGYTVTIYFTMSQETRDILRRVTADGYDPSQEKPDDPQKSKVNAVRLFEEWCRRAPTDPKFMSRFKVVPNAHNLKEIGMPGWISKYNGKPFLIKRPGQTGFLYNHPELSCMEFDISLHPFPYLAKQAICFMKESYFKKILVTFGFVIEGRTDDELPECLIGLMQLCYPDPIHAIKADDFFAGTCNRSF